MIINLEESKCKRKNYEKNKWKKVLKNKILAKPGEVVRTYE